jgi:NADPH:quinone reductase-like Zn-dependent oxidoreductase
MWVINGMRPPSLSLASAALLLAGALGVRMVSRLRLRKQRLDNYSVFVTGASRGLGLAIAMECARRGAGSQAWSARSRNCM